MHPTIHLEREMLSVDLVKLPLHVLIHVICFLCVDGQSWIYVLMLISSRSLTILRKRGTVVPKLCSVWSLQTRRLTDVPFHNWERTLAQRLAKDSVCSKLPLVLSTSLTLERPAEELG